VRIVCITHSLRRRCGTITDTTDCFDIDITTRYSQRDSQAANMHIDGSLFNEHLITPDLIQQLSAGMDALVAKAQRIWQISNEVTSGDDCHAPLTVAAILASVFLAPIVPPEGSTIFGVKGARERLERLRRQS
jgi:hypothetical protein